MGFLEKRVETAGLKHVLIDTPGQIEVFTWSASGSIITETLASTFPTCVVYVMDTPRCDRRRARTVPAPLTVQPPQEPDSGDLHVEHALRLLHPLQDQAAHGAPRGAARATLGRLAKLHL